MIAKTNRIGSSGSTVCRPSDIIRPKSLLNSFSQSGTVYESLGGSGFAFCVNFLCWVAILAQGVTAVGGFGQVRRSRT